MAADHVGRKPDVQHSEASEDQVRPQNVVEQKEGEAEQEPMDTNTSMPCEPNVLQVTEQQNKEEIKGPDETSEHMKINLECLLKNLGLDHIYQEKLSLSKILQIDEKTISDEPPKSNPDLPWYFLKKLMMFNVTARNVELTSAHESVCDVESDPGGLDLDELLSNLQSEDMLNPLDIITALFLCSDGFVQQELAFKMSMCQFAVPLLLPNCDTDQCTLMLWAMRDIVKKYRPPSLSESKGFLEERIVVSELPVVSFVRLGECSLSKSETLNKLLSSSQQYHDTFVHHNMKSGGYPRQISNGLTEISWYLPCGNKNMDVFREPVAVVNLRGDIASFETQFSFLCHTSAAVFVFFDNLDPECKLLTNQNHKAQIFLVGNHQSKRFNLNALKTVSKKLNLSNSQILLRTKQMNDADFVSNLQKTVNSVVENSKMKMKIEQMADIAHELGIWVDEDCEECQTAKKCADAITSKIKDISEFKETQLPLQGKIWKELTCLEKEEFRLRKVGTKNIEVYKSDLKKQRDELRQKQNSYDMSDAMISFISEISTSSIKRSYFLKWMRLNLDNLSRQKLSDLREAYKMKNKSPENKEEIKEIDRKLSNSSLGIEHFFREMGQIYEASVSLPKTNPSREQLKNLPRLCAELLLDGLPIELVDGDTSNIPLTWVTDVLTELNKLVSPQNKILVVTVLGVQSTGKSTLLNTMFGVQFAVSSGRCTRGAFMLLIRVDEDMKKELSCDFLVIIDTEGLKSPELSKLDNSYEHDNELATLVVGLSDITIINIAMENSTEMKDILQIVVHAFLRMKEVGKKPKCQFVHQNVADVSAPEKNLRERKLLLEQLNEMTQAAARMEKKEYKNFTDMMEYNPDTGNMYVPGLWNGSPPMAPVNAGYSEAVYELKKNILKVLGNRKSSAFNISGFTGWITSLWSAVKHEKFIFSFRNSLVAEAYIKLCTEFNKWEWKCKKEMYSWTKTAETKISNFGNVTSEVSDIDQLLRKLKSEVSLELSKWETKLLKNLEEYFKRTDGHVCLVEPYREDFSNSAKSLCREMESSVHNQLTVTTDVRRGMNKVDRIKADHTKELGKRVCALIEECRKKKVNMTDEKLDQEFDQMWNKMMEELTLKKIESIYVMGSVHHYLFKNLKQRGSHAGELLSQKKLQECGKIPFKYSSEILPSQMKNKVLKWFNIKHQVAELQKIADSIITDCSQFLKEKVERKSNYHDTFIQEILHMIDEKLEKSQDVKIRTDFEVSLKQHICADAAREFQKMHETFIKMNDPYECLCQNKERFRVNFKDEYHERDQCQKTAKNFTEQCLTPAVINFVNRSLGPDIIDDMTKRFQFSTRMFFQYSVLLDLLTKENFKDYKKYIRSYEQYIKNWILDEMLKLLTNESVSKFEEQHLRLSIQSINDAVTKANSKEGGNLQRCIQDIRQELGESLVISEDSLGPFMILNNVNPKEFTQWLTGCVTDMKADLQKHFEEIKTRTKLTKVDVKPQNELYKKLVGCGKQCPFCKAPCEAGATEHAEHFTSFHRPEGLGTYRQIATQKLVIDICTSLVSSAATFRCDATNYVDHPFKEYTKIYPDWKIAPDSSFEASDYWKFVLNRFNKEFSEAYDALPAEIPDTWKNITKKQAEESLKKLYAVK